MENDHCHKSLRVLQIKSSSTVGLTTSKSAVRSANLCELAFKRVAPTEVEKEVGLEDHPGFAGRSKREVEDGYSSDSFAHSHLDFNSFERSEERNLAK